MKFSKTSRRTLMLALLAAGSFVYSAIAHFDIPAELMWSFFVKSVVMLVGALLLAGCLAAVVTLAKKIRQR